MSGRVVRLSDLLGGKGALDTPITGLASDSRKVAPGFLFAALKGTRSDGRAFIPQALARGAVALLVPEGSRIDAPVPVIEDRRPAQRLAMMAAAFHGAQPAIMAAVTGTNGKTSTASFSRQLWNLLGRKAASIGTLGIERESGLTPGELTSPDPIALHADLAALAAEGTECAILEASSHGLVQNRLDGVRLGIAAFTNLSHDHLDYHRTQEAYFHAKARLFSELLPDDGQAVISLAGPHGERMADLARGRGTPVITVGREPGATLCVLEANATKDGQSLRVLWKGDSCKIALPLIGDFQADNALLAAAIVMASGARPAETFAAMSELKPVPGRLEFIGRTTRGGSVYVDFAHTPEGLRTVLETMRRHCPGRLHVLFGCGGDRDRSKRPAMGRIAAEAADIVIVTDDNPRHEDPTAIRRAILEGAPKAREIADRGSAIRAAIAMLEEGDCLVIAGKGHERGQIIGDEILPFSDRAFAALCLKENGA